MTLQELSIDLDSLYHPEDEDYLPFQKVDIAQMVCKMNNVLLANEMGTGKTIEACGLINALRPKAVVVMCPNNLRFNWLGEIEKWVDPEYLQHFHGGIEAIEMCTTSAFIPHTFVIASFEGMTRWHSVLKEILAEGGLLLIDEGHFLKNENTKRYKAVLEFKNMPGVKAVIMTGTPIPNYPYELYNLINFLDDEQWFGRTAFEKRYCPYKNKYAYHMDELSDLLRHGQIVQTKASEVDDIEITAEALSPGPLMYHCTKNKCDFQTDNQMDSQKHMRETYTKGELHIMEGRQTSRAAFRAKPTKRTTYEKVRAPGVMIRRLKKEVLPELPRKRRQIIGLPAEGKLLELVLREKQMWAEMAKKDAEMESLLIGDIQESDEAFEARIERLQFTRKYFFEEISIIRHELAKAKVPYVIEHIQDILENKDKLVVFIHHRDVGEAIRDAFADKAVLVYGGMAQDRVYAAKEKFWNDPQCELFIGSLKMAGVGLNLQVASNIIFAELDWVPGTITQAEDRCHRIGQEHSLLIQHLVAHDSMDASMAQRILKKQKTINTALNRPNRDAEALTPAEVERAQARARERAGSYGVEQ